MPRKDHGFVRLWRKIFSNEELRDNAIARLIFMDFILLASHKEYKGLKRGQLFTSNEMIKERYKFMVGTRPKYLFSLYQVKQAMKTLVNCRMIDRIQTYQGSVITILNYDKYQTPFAYEKSNEQPVTRPDTRPDIYNKEWYTKNIYNIAPSFALDSKDRIQGWLPLSMLCAHLEARSKNPKAKPKHLKPDKIVSRIKQLTRIADFFRNGDSAVVEATGFNSMKELMTQAIDDRWLGFNPFMRKYNSYLAKMERWKKERQAKEPEDVIGGGLPRAEDL